MAFNIFKNKKDADKEETKDDIIKDEASIAEDVDGSDVEEIKFSSNAGEGAFRTLEGFYVSEKSSMGSAFNQYTFRVFGNATKSEVKKDVSKLFNVKVESVKMIKRPRKRRDLGRHTGFKKGFKKAIVVLKEGNTIGQAKP